MKKKNWKKFILFLVKFAIIWYCLIGTGLYFLQKPLIFHPDELAENYKFDFSFPFKEVNLPYTSESNINIVQFLQTDSVPKGVVLYFHGNGQNITRYAPQSLFFTKNKYEVWMIDYPGYGKSTGELSEQVLYDWAKVFYTLARARFPKDKIILYGRSLGTGIAAQLASVRDCKALILESPYYSMPSLAATKAPIFPVNQMLKFKFPTWQYLQMVIAPVSIFHGTKDKLIPISQAKKLLPFLKKNDVFIPVADAGHNTVSFNADYANKIDSILQH